MATTKKAIDLDQLSPEQMAILEKQFQEKQEAAAKKKREERQAYKDLVNEAVPELFAELVACSQRMGELKHKVFESLKDLIVMKTEIFGKSDDQYSHSFTTDAGITLMIGRRYNDNYDDTVTAGISKVKAYLKTLAKDKNSETLVDTIMKLLSQDSKGNLKASRVLQLKQMAEKLDAPELLDGINIILDAYSPVKTKEFVTVKYKDNDGKPVDLPLDMTSVSVDFKLNSNAAEQTLQSLQEKNKETVSEA